jgi:ribonuclease G
LVGQRNFDDTVFKTNLEAAQSIARQLRLRNLGGMIVVDFIDMDNAEHRTAVLEELRRALARVRHAHYPERLHGAWALVEMTRKRTRESLAHVLCEPWRRLRRPRRGEVSARTVCYEVAARDPARGARVRRARAARARLATGLRPVPGRGVGRAGDALGFHRQAVSVQVETGYSAGAIRYRPAMKDICFTPAAKLAQLIRAASSPRPK